MAVLGFVLVAACSNSDYAGSVSPSVATAPTSKTAPAKAVANGSVASYGTPAFGAPVTGADGYPNINVDTARRPTGLARSAAEQDKLEAELLALGARHRSTGENTASAIQELQELGRRSRAEAEQQIESGSIPTTP